MELSFVNLYGVYREVLDHAERRVLRLVEVDRVSYADVACDLGLTREDVGRLVFRARAKLHWGMSKTLEELRSGPAA